MLAHPKEFGAGVLEPTITGAVLSIFTITEAVVESPAPLVALQVIVVPGVSEVRVWVPQPEEEEIPDWESATVQETVTSPLFQPLLFGVGLTFEVIVGGVSSIRSVTAPLVAKSLPTRVALTLKV